MNRDRLPNIRLDGRFRRVLNLGIADRIAKSKEEKELDGKEDDMRLQRLGFNEKYFNNR